MISNEHKQHSKKYPLHKHEIGIWGIGCTALQELYDFVRDSNSNYIIGYFDIKHQAEVAASHTVLHHKLIHLQQNNQVNHPQISHFFNVADLLIINGNHEEATNMWLILNGKKEYKHDESKLAKTSFIFCNEKTKDIAVALKLQNPNIELILGTEWANLNEKVTFFLQSIKPTMNGLILTGGESTRMKQNKSLIVYHQQPQWLHLFYLLKNFCEETYISCTEKNANLYDQKNLIVDQLLGYGPLSGIISALLKFKDKAILVLACDLPLIDEATITHLIEERDASKMATTFFNEESGFLEPLITIYEPKALSIMLSMLAQGYSCPRKMLMQNDIKIINPKNTKTLKNINNAEEKEEILKMIKQDLTL